MACPPPPPSQSAHQASSYPARDTPGVSNATGQASQGNMSQSMTIKPIPRSFSTTDDAFDTATQFCNVPLKKVVAKTNWTDRNGLAGKRIDEVSIIDLLYRGWEDSSLRYLSQGDFVGLIPTRSVAEAVFLSAIRDALRSKKVDIDKMAYEFCKNSNPEVATPDKKSKTKDFMTPVVDQIMKVLLNPSQARGSEDHKSGPSSATLSGNLPVQDSSLNTPARKRVRELEEHIAQLLHVQKKAKVSDKSPEDAYCPDIPEKPLDANIPTCGTKIAVRAWITKMSKGMEPDKANALNNYIEGVVKFKPDPKEHLPLADVAVAWGLPAKYATEWSTDAVKRIIAVAAMKAS